MKDSDHTTPLVSVIVPVFNGERYLAEAIESVFAQTYRHWELIVIDDGSTDGSADVARRFESVRYDFQENQGISAARNRGIELAKGEVFALLDADDVWTPEKLELQMSALERDPTADLVFGHVREFVSPELDESVKRGIRCTDGSVPGHIPSTMLAGRDSFLRVGLFETNWRMGEFASWYARALEIGLNRVMLPDLVALRRLHDANNGIQQRDAAKDYVRILKASLDRRRKAGEAGVPERGDD